MEQETKSGQIYREIMILLIIMMIGTLLRLPIGHFNDMNVTMLYDPDSYFYARKAIEYYNQPISDWSLFFNRVDDPLMNENYIDNSEELPMLLPIITAILCKAFKSLPIDYIIFYISTVLSVLAAIPTYLFVKKHSTAFGGLLAAAFTVLSIPYFIHTKYGYFDTDVLIFVFALSFMLSYIDFLFATKTKEKLVLAAACFASLVLFILSWSTYFVYVAIALILFFVHVVFSILVKKRSFPSINALFSATIMFMCLLKSRKSILSMFLALISQKKESLWPFPGKYIDELSLPSFICESPNTGFIISRNGILNFSGGYTFFFAFLISVAIFIKLCSTKDKKSSINLNYNNGLVLMLLVWIAIAFVIALKGIRYVQLLVLPLIILVAYSTAVVIDYYGKIRFSGIKKDLIVILLAVSSFGGIALADGYFAILVSILVVAFGLTKNSFTVRHCVYAFLFVFFVNVIINCYIVSFNSQRFVDDDLQEVAEYLDDNTPENSAVVSWWDYGYYLQYATGRQIVADGGTYDGEEFYWLSNAFVTDNPQLTEGICNMFTGGSIDASRLACKYAKSEVNGTRMLKDILSVGKTDAMICLKEKYKLDENEIRELIKYSHPSNNKQIYIIVSDKMMRNSTVLAYYGFWNFKAEQFFDYNEKFDYKNDKEFYPLEIRDSVLLKLYFGELPFGFSEVFSNAEFKIFALDKLGEQTQ